MRIALIVAADEGNVIGANGAMPWHVPEELAHFRQLTMGRPLIMGRKTFESIGRALPGRHSIVLTRDTSWSHPGVECADEFDAAVRLARGVSRAGFDTSEVFVIGGAEIYALALPRAQRIYLTRMHARFAGDAHFPVLDSAQWQQSACELRSATPDRDFAMSYLVFDRVEAAARREVR